MRASKKALIAICISILFCLSFVSCGNDTTLSLWIYSPEDGATFDVNVQKVSGVVTNPKAIVTVNDIAATVTSDGAFYAYINLVEGENTIEIEAHEGDSNSSKIITVNFTPALAIYVDIEPEDGEVDYRLTPLAVTGWVTDARAEVMVNGEHAQVDADGSFFSHIQLQEGNNTIKAMAVLDGREGEMSYLVGLNPEGKLIYVPGWISFYFSRQSYEDSIQLKLGESKSIDFTLSFQNDLRYPQAFNYQIFRVSEMEGEEEIAMPEGLAIYIELSEFIIYPNTTYDLRIVAIASANVSPGEYYFHFIPSFSLNLIGKGCIKVIIEE